MAHQLEPHEGEEYLTPGEIAHRLEGEFSFVEVDAEAGMKHVDSMIRQFERMHAPQAMIDEHRLLRVAAIHFVVADDPNFVDEYLSFVALPGDGILIGYHSQQHQDAALPLLERCCAVLGYEMHLL